MPADGINAADEKGTEVSVRRRFLAALSQIRSLRLSDVQQSRRDRYDLQKNLSVSKIAHSRPAALSRFPASPMANNISRAFRSPGPMPPSPPIPRHRIGPVRQDASRHAAMVVTLRSNENEAAGVSRPL